MSLTGGQLELVARQRSEVDQCDVDALTMLSADDPRSTRVVTDRWQAGQTQCTARYVAVTGTRYVV